MSQQHVRLLLNSFSFQWVHLKDKEKKRKKEKKKQEKEQRFFRVDCLEKAKNVDWGGGGEIFRVDCLEKEKILIGGRGCH